MSKIVKDPGKDIAVAICPAGYFITQLGHALMPDEACEFACAERMRRNN